LFFKVIYTLSDLLVLTPKTKQLLRLSCLVIKNIFSGSSCLILIQAKNHLMFMINWLVMELVSIITFYVYTVQNIFKYSPVQNPSYKQLRLLHNVCKTIIFKHVLYLNVFFLNENTCCTRQCRSFYVLLPTHSYRIEYAHQQPRNSSFQFNQRFRFSFS